jgi:hypothetical protein
MAGRELKPETRARLVELLELPADADSEAINAAVDKLVSGAAESAVATAISTGKILAAHRDYWLAAFKTDRKGTEAVLNSLAPVATTAVPPMPPDLAASRPIAPARPQSFAEAQAAVLKAPMSDEEANAALWKLGGPGIRAGLTPPPDVIGPTLPGWES